MRNKYIIKSLYHRKLSSILMIIQLSICILVFLFLIQLSVYYYDKIKVYNNIIKPDKSLVIDSSKLPRESSYKVYQGVKDILKLQESGEITGIRVFSQNGSFNINNKYYPCYMASENLLNALNIKLDQGRWFTKEEMDCKTFREEVPIVIGSKLGEYLKLGDTLEQKYKYSNEDTENEYTRIFKVVGIAKPGSMVVLSSYFSVYSIEINDYGIYAPLSIWKYNLTDKTKDKAILNKSIDYQNKYNLNYEVHENKIIKYKSDFIDSVINFKFQILVSENQDTEKVNKIINDLAKKDGSNMKFVKSKKENEPFVELLQQSFIGLSIFSIVLFIFSILGITGTTLYSINNRKKEFGIRLSQGATINEIAGQIVKEILFINIAALILVVIAFNIIKICFGKYIAQSGELANLMSFNTNALLFVFGLILFSTFCSVILPIKKIRSLNVVDLIRKGE